jgi:transcriptional regulator with XRE-family HTH domain
MSTAESNQQTRLLTPAELAVCIRMFREMRQWSQEQLAEISGLNVRTVQRVEQGLSASLDTRRALASAFEFEDIDALNKPFTIPSEEELKAAKEKFDREHVTLTAIPLTTGKQLAKLAEICSMDLSEPGFELTREADETFAALVDYFRDYRDCADVYSETQKFDVYDEMQSHIDALKTLGVSLRYAERKMQVKWGTEPDSKPMPVNVLYVVAFPLGKEPEQFATPKSGGIRL